MGLGSLLGGAGLLGLDIWGQHEARQADRASTAKQMSFQEFMSNTSHQRETKDLIAAGLNPALSANSGASTPVGASYDSENLMSGAGGVVASAQAAKRLKKDIESADANIDVSKGLAEKARQDALNSARQGHLLELDFDRARAESGFWRSHPNYLKWRKYGELASPYAATARDVAVGAGALKFGFGGTAAKAATVGQQTLRRSFNKGLLKKWFDRKRNPGPRDTFYE